MEEAPNWADLPNDLLYRMFTTSRLDLGDFVRFPAVCNGWRNSESLPDPLPQTPWLLECQYVARISLQPNINFYSLPTGQTGAIPAPEQCHGIMYHGPGHGYLLALCPEKDPCLLNPLTGNKIPLPELNLGSSRIDSLVCNGLGSGLNWYILSHLDHDNGAMAYTCIIYHQDKNCWTCAQVDISDHTSCPICYFNGKLFATVNGFFTEVYDAISGQKLYEVLPPDDEENSIYVKSTHLDEEYSIYVKSTHLVESSGDILRVILYGEEGSDDFDEIEDSRFEIYKLCSQGGGDKEHFWVEVTDIGNQILFLDAVTGFSLKAPPGFNGNCIYFMSDMGSKPRRYDIGTGAVQEVPCPFDYCTWFIPSLH